MENKEPFLEIEEKKNLLSQPKFWATIATSIIGVVLVVVFYKTVIKTSMSAAEVGAAIQVVWHDSKWVDKVGRPGEAIIVPSFTFKLKNMSQHELQYVYFEGVFEYEENGEKISDGFTPALKNPLPSGQTSDEIFIKSHYGYRASSKKAFFQNIDKWKKVRMRLFARTKNSSFALIGIFPIKQEIEGVNVVFQK